MNEAFSTAEAAKEIGCTIQYLRLILQRHEHLKPKNTFGGSFIWTREEIEAVRNRNRKPGRPAKDGD
jgi:hypothetical protein